MINPSQSVVTSKTSTGLGPSVLSTMTVSEMARKAHKLLWVDDSPLLLSLYKSVFESMGFEVLATSSPEDALQHLSSHMADMAILDYDMPEMDGGMLASMLKDRWPSLPVILYSGNDCIPQSARHWVDAICSKASPREELLATIESLSHFGWQGVEVTSPLKSLTPPSSH